MAFRLSSPLGTFSPWLPLSPLLRLAFFVFSALFPSLHAANPRIDPRTSLGFPPFAIAVPSSTRCDQLRAVGFDPLQSDSTDSACTRLAQHSPSPWPSSVVPCPLLFLGPLQSLVIPCVSTLSILLADHLYGKCRREVRQTRAMCCTEVGSAFLVVISVTRAQLLK